MKLFELFGQPVKWSNTKPHSAKDLLLAGIEKQLQLLAGQRIENKSGSVIKSWFASGGFVPMVGNRPLLGEKTRIPCESPDRQEQMLIALRDDVTTGSCDTFLIALEKKRSAKRLP